MFSYLESDTHSLKSRTWRIAKKKRKTMARPEHAHSTHPVIKCKFLIDQ